MSDYEKIACTRRALEKTRNDLARRIAEDAPNKADLIELHDRVRSAIKALHGRS